MAGQIFMRVDEVASELGVSKVRRYESVIDRQNLWHLFGRDRVKTHSRNDAR